MASGFRLTATLDADAIADLTDTLNAKRALLRLGYFKPPAYGLTPYPDKPLFDGIRRFQKAHDLKPDGVMKPGGATERALAAALANANGKADGKAEGKSGTYVWHTQGDGKVRSEHAERDGTIFSWDDPPEGGHPGEAPNCRCWAEERHCMAEWLALRKIVERLVPLDAELTTLVADIHNLEIEVERNNADIEELELAAMILATGRILDFVPHPLARAVKIAAQVTKAMVAIKLREIQAELKVNQGKLLEMRKSRPQLAQEVRTLKNQEDVAQKAYRKCMER